MADMNKLLGQLLGSGTAGGFAGGLAGSPPPLGASVGFGAITVSISVEYETIFRDQAGYRT